MLVNGIRMCVQVAWLAGISVVTLEAATRVDDWINRGADPVDRYDMEVLYMDSPLGTVGRPGARYAKWGLNEEGLRGPPLKFDERQTHIITYGASETFGLYEDEGMEYPRQLEMALNRNTAKPGFEVVNVSLPGMRLGSGVPYLMDVAKRVKPRYVFVYPSPAHYIGAAQSNCGSETKSARPQQKSRLQLRIARKTYDLVKELIPHALLTAVRKASIAWTMRDREVLTRTDAASMQVLGDDLACAVSAIRSAGAEPILLTHAHRFADQPRPDDMFWLIAWRQQHPELSEQALLHLDVAANAVIKATADQHSIRLVDVDRLLSGRDGLFKDYSHFSNEGAAKMGNLLAAAVAVSKTVGSSAADGVAGRPMSR